MQYMYLYIEKLFFSLLFITKIFKNQKIKFIFYIKYYLLITSIKN